MCNDLNQEHTTLISKNNFSSAKLCYWETESDSLRAPRRKHGYALANSLPGYLRTILCLDISEPYLITATGFQDVIYIMHTLSAKD